jgi:nicotinate phosphoribosyltransferase
VTIVDAAEPTRRKDFTLQTPHEDLLVPVMRGGEIVYDSPTLESIRARAQQQLRMLHPGIKRFQNPHLYPAGLEQTLHELKTEMILRAKAEAL